MNVVTLLHRFLGETMLLIALVGVILAIIGLVRKKEMEKAENVFGVVYAGLFELLIFAGRMMVA